jgi:probable HAF family extracellular repeat protein
VATAINGHSEVVGYSPVGGSFHTFLYSNGKMTDLGKPNANGFFGPSGINNSDEIVSGAFIYRSGTWYSLNDLIDPRDSLYGVINLIAAAAINNKGQIVVDGCYTTGPQKGVCDALRLDPLPMFAGTPGKANCHGKSVSALAQQYGGLDHAAAALGYSSVQVLQNGIAEYCAG